MALRVNVSLDKVNSESLTKGDEFFHSVKIEAPNSIRQPLMYVLDCSYLLLYFQRWQYSFKILVNHSSNPTEFKNTTIHVHLYPYDNHKYFKKLIMRIIARRA